MNDATTLELALEPDEAPGAERRQPVRKIAAAAIIVTMLAGAAQFVGGSAFDHVRDAFGWQQQPGRLPAPVVRVTPQQRQAVASLTVDDQAQIVVAGKLAAERNAGIPVSHLPLEKARAFLIAKATADSGGGVYGNAVTCLTQAVYYEAAHEPMTGRRAVAQVVLNRMRHPAYPKSVCGVVYQGSERRTGCQFSFTCDGSLLRAPGAGAWSEARDVARAALGGYVEPSVGTATHYHANYVLPKWAFQLAKIQQIGAHIFYRFPGGWGDSRAFNGAYAGHEWIPAVNYDALRQRQELAVASGSGIPHEVLTDGLTVPPHVTDRHDPRDVGGRINVTKLWRMTIPGPGEASSGYRAMLDAQGEPAEEAKPLPVSNSAASALPAE